MGGSILGSALNGIGPLNFNESVRLVAALRQQGVEPEQLALPDEVHDFLTFANWTRVYHATAEFFGRKLRR